MVFEKMAKINQGRIIIALEMLRIIKIVADSENHYLLL